MNKIGQTQKDKLRVFTHFQNLALNAHTYTQPKNKRTIWTNRRERCKQERMIGKQERVIVDGYEVNT